MIKRLLPLVGVLLLSGCEVFEPKACTLIGCEDALTVSVTGITAGTASVEVKAGDATMTATCEVRNGKCDAYFARFIPTAATVTVRTATQTVSRTVSIAYQDSQPNGPGCNPICRQATVSVAI
jgi:hypothetical protein